MPHELNILPNRRLIKYSLGYLYAVAVSAWNVRFGVTSVALGDRWLPLDFRYIPFATEAMRRRKMTRRAITGSRLTHQEFGRARYRVVRPPSMAARRRCSLIRAVPQGAGPACTFPGTRATGEGRGSLRAARRGTPDRSA